MMERCRREETTAEHIHRDTLKCLPGQSCTAGPSSERLSQLYPSCSVPPGAEITDMDFSETCQRNMTTVTEKQGWISQHSYISET